MNLTPLHDNIIIKTVDTKEQATESGIILPDTAAKERPEQGEVIAVGPGKVLKDGTRYPMSVSVGQKVFFKKYSTDEVKIQDEEFLVISESDILAIIN